MAKEEDGVDARQFPTRRVIAARNCCDVCDLLGKVVDTCLVNQMTYDPIAKTTLQSTVPCPKSASKQRGGRAGRMIPALCVRMVTQTEWNHMPDTEPPQPELEDMSLVYLRLMRNARPEVRNQILDELRVPEELRAMAIEHLLTNDMIKWDGQLTDLGRFVSDLEPGEPELGALLWYGKQHNVLSEAFTIYTILSPGTGFVAPKAKSAFLHADADLHTMLSVWNLASWIQFQTSQW